MRYRNFNEMLKEQFGEKVYRVVLKGGFTCPNRDGRLARGGCTFCNEEGHRPTTMLGEHGWPSVTQQLERGIGHIKERFNTHKYIAYFQDYSATYAPAATLRAMFDEALAFPDVHGLIVGTRSDCLGPEVLELLSEINQRTYLWVEMGLQSANDESLKRIRRYHTVQSVADTAHRLFERGIRVGVHVMFGLPGEGRDDILRTAQFVGELGFQGVKLHNVYVLRRTVLAQQFETGDYEPLSQAEYVSLCVDFLERIPPEVVVQRLSAQGPKPLMLAPAWCLNKHRVRIAIEAELLRRDTWQGKLIAPAASGAPLSDKKAASAGR